MTYLGPALDPPLSGSDRKNNTCKNLEHFIHIKFRKSLLSCSIVKIDFVFDTKWMYYCNTLPPLKGPLLDLF